MKVKVFTMTLLCVASLTSQIKTVSIEELHLPPTERWSHPIFSPTGKEIFLTNSDYNGIWQYSLETKVLKEITRDMHSGFAFTVSDDGKKIAYRRTVQPGDHRTRIQESVELNLLTAHENIIDRGNSIPTPVFVNAQAIAGGKSLSKQTTTQIPVVLGIDETKIALLINGEKKILDPLNGQYIWPMLSPDRTKLVAVEMDKGAFVCTIEGANVQRIGKCNAPSWTYDGKWIIGMDDRDDGHSIYASDIIAISPDGKRQYNLTVSFDGIALYPSCSTTETKIVFTTIDGGVFLLTYEEVQ